MLEKEWVGVEYLKKGKLLISHRYNLLPLLPSGPGGVHRELVVQDLPLAGKTNIIYLFSKVFSNFYFCLSLSEKKLKNNIKWRHENLQ